MQLSTNIMVKSFIVLYKMLYRKNTKEKTKNFMVNFVFYDNSRLLVFIRGSFL